MASTSWSGVRFGHGRDVYDELIHVPLIIWGSIDESLAGRRVAEAVEVRSVAHTLAKLAQVPDNIFQGEDLLSIPGASRRDRLVFSEGSYALGSKHRKLMVEREGWKLIHNLDDGGFELYDLVRDPAERDNLWARETRSAKVARSTLQQALDRFAARQAVEAPSIVLSPEEIERLEALGYLNPQ